MEIVTEQYWDGLGNEVITVDPKDGVTVKTYNQLNLLAWVDLPTENFWENGTQVMVTPYQRYEYNQAGFKTAEIHQLPGSNTEITNKIDVDDLGRTIRITTPYSASGVSQSAVTETYYDGNGNKIRVVDANNTSLPYGQQKATIYAYSTANLLVAETDPSGNETTYTYDKDGNRTGMTDPRGNSGKYAGDFSIVYQYDDLNRLITGLLPMALGQTTKPVVSLNYDARGNLLQRVEPDGGQTNYTYTARNKVNTETSTGNGVSYTTTYNYDLVGNEIETIDPKGNKTEKEYDDLNHVITITYPEQTGKVIERYQYDQVGNKTDYINGRSVLTHYDYDLYNHLIKVTDGNKGVTSYHYDRWGNMTQVVNALGFTSNYTYDELNRLLQETDPAGFTKQYGYDPVGNRSWSLDPNGTMSRYTYTPNNLVSQVTLQNGDTNKEIDYQYDEASFRNWVNYDNVITQYNTGASGYTPDPYNRINLETKNFDGQTFTVAYSYDVEGRTIGITYPNGQTVNYQYNSLGQLQKVPGFVDQTPIYDNGGLLTSITASNGITANYSYDQNGRLTGLSYANQSAATLKSYSLTYDEANNIIKKNSDSFQYDLLNQLLYANLNGSFENSPGEEVQKVGNTVSDFKGQQSFGFELNQMDIIDLDYAAGSIGVDLLAQMNVTKIDLQPNSPINRVTKPSSIRVYYSQDNVTYTRLTGWTMAVLDKGVVEIVLNSPLTTRFIKIKSMFDERDVNLNPVNQATFMNTPEDLIHVYYLMDTRLEEYTYDPLGNRTAATVTQRNPVAQNYTYDNYSIRLLSNGKYNFTYDANGNLITKTTIDGSIVWNYSYDLFNRLIQVSNNGNIVASYMYDDSGLRIKKQGTSSTTYYSFDTGGNVLYQQEGSNCSSYVYVLGKHFARVDGNLDNSNTTKYFYQTDNLG